MSLLYFQALKDLPDEFVHEDTIVCEHPGLIVAANPNLPPYIFREETMEWKQIVWMEDKSKPENERWRVE